ncbi:transcriptional regulator [Sphaerochaeta pleomorpha str. Grapes]|uniref:Transcriptional regulator n=1 Tax=Sphaerochaeta pleomorpha (strain ATCC BAA-1885 / DSM 22778 / Grapes) TaxID=158190 RepID=G8QV95_SPHPG|nr:FadR/GntR family transcriptional regulator [Sphaerochaeta pleomorpha]AEV30410.1 transcriptional regulator [Sphaerochaeta pleomorpha str. Grapes]
MDVSDFSLSRTNLSQQVADHLEEVILASSSTRVSEKLPSEMKLAKQYNVSRPVIREALKLLQERGLVTLKNGSGAYITKPETDTVMTAVSRIMQVDNISPEELTEVRGILEMSAVELAAVHANAEQLARMDHILKLFNDKTLPLKDRVALDASFHIAIAEASGNELLTMFVEVLTSLLKEYMGKGILIQGGIDDAIDRHRKILDALSDHDVGLARLAMTEHLKVSSENVRQFDSRSQAKEN